MAILLNGFKTKYGNIIDNAYARIRFIVINYESKQIQVELAIYASKEAADAGAQPIDYSVNIALPNNMRLHNAFENAFLADVNIVQLAYQFAKDTDERLRNGADDDKHDYAERVRLREEESKEPELPLQPSPPPPPPDSTTPADAV
jgi:hypothetical protein